MPRIFSEAVHKTIPPGILSTDYQYCEKKGNEVGFVVIRNFSPSSKQLISSMLMTALIALKYIIASSLFELFVQSARFRRGASPRGKITFFFTTAPLLDFPGAAPRPIDGALYCTDTRRINIARTLRDQSINLQIYISRNISNGY